MERQIGEKFKFNGQWYITLKELSGCENCIFKKNRECSDLTVRRELGDCGRFTRKDSQGVIFVKTEAPVMETEAPRCLTFEKSSSNKKKILLLI